MINHFLGIEYGRGATARLVDDGPALAPEQIQKLFPDANWTVVPKTPVDLELWKADRFGENLPVQQATYNNTPTPRHIMIGGDHSLNFGHFSAIADQMPDTDLCLVYIDAHLDIHSHETSRAQASGAPHGTNVRALCGIGDPRWLQIPKRIPALKPENVFYLGTRSYEPAEIEFVRENNIYMKSPDELKNNLDNIINEIRARIGDRPFVVSFDFDSIDPKYFPDVLVPESNGITVDMAATLLSSFKNAVSFEFVEYAPSGNAECVDIARRLISIAQLS